MKRILFLSILLASNSFADIFTLLATANSQTCASSKDCKISSTHDIKIINNTPQNHKYQYSYSLCTEEGECHSSGYFFTVNAYSYWENHYDNWMIVKFNLKGNYNFIANTLIWGYEMHDAQDENSVSVE